MKKTLLIFFLALSVFCLACDHDTTEVKATTTKTTAPAPGPIVAETPAGEQTAAPSRVIFVLLDCSVSYKLYEQALDKLIDLVRNLPPGSVLIVGRVADEFKPESSILAQMRLPAVPRNLLIPTLNVHERRAKQTRLDQIWRKIDQQRNELIAYLDQQLRGKNQALVSDLYGGLRYSSDRLRSEAERLRNENVAAELFLLVFSDLEMDFGKQNTVNPPAKLSDWRDVHAHLLYVPYDSGWTQRQLNWESWFKQGHAKSSAMLDVSQSRMTAVIAANFVPRKIPPMDSKTP